MKKFSKSEIDKIIAELDFSKIEGGLIPVVVQDEEGEILMLGFANEDAVRKSLETGYAHFYSRSRKTLWKKGETSGHLSEIKELRIDCDQDTILFVVKQTVGACHTGFYSCFYRIFENGEFKEVGKKVFDPDEVY